MSDLRIVPAVIGWSNWRAGCEFYEDTERNGDKYARWLPRDRRGWTPDQPYGRLLTDFLGDPEGATAIVVVLPGRGTDPAEAMAKIDAALRDDGSNATEVCPGCGNRRKRTEALCLNCRMGLADA